MIMQYCFLFLLLLLLVVGCCCCWWCWGCCCCCWCCCCWLDTRTSKCTTSYLLYESSYICWSCCDAMGDHRTSHKFIEIDWQVGKGRKGRCVAFTCQDGAGRCPKCRCSMTPILLSLYNICSASCVPFSLCMFSLRWFEFCENFATWGETTHGCHIWAWKCNATFDWIVECYRFAKQITI